MISSALVLPAASAPRCLTSHARPISWLLLKFYTLEVVLYTLGESEDGSAPTIQGTYPLSLTAHLFTFEDPTR